MAPLPPLVRAVLCLVPLIARVGGQRPIFLAAASRTTHTCPTGSSGVSKDRCFEAAQSAGQRDGRPAGKKPLIIGSWHHMPPGCNIHEATRNGTQPHFNTKPEGKDHDVQFRLVCQKDGACLPARLLACVCAYARCSLLSSDDPIPPRVPARWCVPPSVCLSHVLTRVRLPALSAAACAATTQVYPHVSVCACS